MAGSKKGRKLPPRREDLIGRRFEKLVVAGFADSRCGSARWLCYCDCGNERVVFAASLKSGSTVSCGCKRLRPFDGRLSSAFFTEAELNRFVELAQKMPSGCMRWNGGYYKNGYGRFFGGHRAFRAHRVAFVIATGRTIRPSNFICHTCDNPWCVSPGHLYLGTAKTNASDRESRCRGRYSKHQAAEALGL